MVLNSLGALGSGFEGCEKKLEIDFVGADMRTIPRISWDDILAKAQCSILSVKKNEHFVSYLLSESSLFVFPLKIIVKTCGSTSLLFCLPLLLETAKEIGAFPNFVQFSRSNFMFPHQQPYPHRSFDAEVAYLNKFFKGTAYILGPLNGPRWNLYIADFDTSVNVSTDQTLEVIMFNLNPERMKPFFESENGAENSPELAEEATVTSGIDKLIPGASIDSYMFSPCGYSSNGMLQDSYFTVHITPEPECSFVSFETNLRLSSYTRLVKRVVDLFDPASFCVSLFVDKNSVPSDANASLEWSYDGFVTTDHTFHEFEGHYNVAAGNFQAIEPPNRPVFGSIAFPGLSAETLKRVADAAAEEKRSNEAPGRDGVCRVAPPAIRDVFGYEDRLVLPYQIAKTLEARQLRLVALSAVKEQFHVSEFDSSLQSDFGGLIASIIQENQTDEAFFVVNVSDIVDKFVDWASDLPEVRPFFSVECNSDPALLLALNSLGSGFSGFSVDQLEPLLSLGVKGRDLLLSNPWPSVSQITLARSRDIGFMSFDNEVELHKFKKHYPSAKLMLTLAAEVMMPTKDCRRTPRRPSYGARLSEALSLLKLAKELKDVNIVGVTLAFGEDCTVPLLQAALKDAKTLFLRAKDLGFHFTHLHLGSKGWDQHIVSQQQDNGPSLPSAPSLASSVAKSLRDSFPFTSSDVHVIADPSTFLVSSALTVVVTIVSKRSTPLDSGERERGGEIDAGGRGETHFFEGSTGEHGCAVAGDGEGVLCVGRSPREREGHNRGFGPPGTLVTGGEAGSQHVHRNAQVWGQGASEGVNVGESVSGLGSKRRERAGGEKAVLEETMSGLTPLHATPSRPVVSKSVRMSYFVDDGIYRSFPFLQRGRAKFVPSVVPRLDGKRKHSHESEVFESTIWGRTCDSLDCILESVLLPELEQDEWLYFKNMGANTISLASSFNGFPPAQALYIAFS